MNDSEWKVCCALEAEGYTVLRHGWPDLLAIHEQRGVIGVEVKGRHDAVSDRQSRMHKALAQIGLPTALVEMRPGWDAIAITSQRHADFINKPKIPPWRVRMCPCPVCHGRGCREVPPDRTLVPCPDCDGNGVIENIVHLTANVYPS